ncbi:hypothetical protein E3U23_02305 [Erythrobacter litoralis]|uniref:TonB-dependent receptor plug domain-containing protein n=1 Tax=Erythrobacter litoralis TaxID=39960 RepID=UPI002435D80C|nr:TonB-dependent receptor plug domain-containing protein [Erythrobacter litoralis]MDG6078030.1 hypothetical protein [Erythrobacter litoralis]
MRAISKRGTALMALIACSHPAAALAQDSPEEADLPPVQQQDASDTRRIYEPAFFERFAPRNALDMVARIPGFAITGGDDNGQRGLGQANQNVIVNGQRFSSKSDGVRDQLARIPSSDVVRIELVDGNTLDIPGLTGLVANVIVESSGASGQFRYVAGFRAYNTEPQLYGGEISLSGKSGKLDYKVALSNNNERFGADGPTILYGADGAVIEEQYTSFSGAFDNPKLATNFTYTFGPRTIANLNLSYGEDFYYRTDPETGRPLLGPVRVRDNVSREDGPEYEIGGDFEFPLGPGKLKLIGLERFERDNFSNDLIDSFGSEAPPVGSRFLQTNGIGERIARAEYGWAMWKADWQLSGEAAYNRLDRVSSLFLLGSGGEFEEIDFPAGTGGVKEDRYETSLSVSKKLSNTLSLQAIGAAEFSTLTQSGSAANSRSFTRPKGSLAMTWKPRADLDVSLTLARRVSQLSFGDFLASVSLGNDNQNGGNNALVPYQSWDIELEANKTLGAWGSLRFQARQGWFEDFIDWFPLPDGGEARGNIGSAERTHLELSGTINFDPVGWRGARLDFTGIKRWMTVTDPFVGGTRPFSYDLIDQLEGDFRQDIPRSDWAYGASLFTFNPAGYSRRYEFGRDWEGPTFLDLFVENKDVFGLTVRGAVGNILGARNRFERTVFDGSRPDGEILFVEQTDRRIGPTFRVTITGDF